MAKTSPEDKPKQITLRGPSALFDLLDTHIQETSGWQKPNRNSWILNAIEKQLAREKSEQGRGEPPK